MATHSHAWRIPGTGEPGGLPSMGSHRVRHDWSNLAAAAAVYYYLKSPFLILRVIFFSSILVLAYFFSTELITINTLKVCLYFPTHLPVSCSLFSVLPLRIILLFLKVCPLEGFSMGVSGGTHSQFLFTQNVFVSPLSLHHDFSWLMLWSYCWLACLSSWKFCFFFPLFLASIVAVV